MPSERLTEEQVECAGVTLSSPIRHIDRAARRFHAYPDGAAEDAVAGADVAPVASNIAELHGNPGERRQEREVVNASIEDRADTGNSWTTMQRKYRRQKCVAHYGK